MSSKDYFLYWFYALLQLTPVFSHYAAIAAHLIVRSKSSIFEPSTFRLLGGWEHCCCCCSSLLVFILFVFILTGLGRGRSSPRLSFVVSVIGGRRWRRFGCCELYLSGRQCHFGQCPLLLQLSVVCVDNILLLLLLLSLEILLVLFLPKGIHWRWSLYSFVNSERHGKSKGVKPPLIKASFPIHLKPIHHLNFLHILQSLHPSPCRRYTLLNVPNPYISNLEFAKQYNYYHYYSVIAND